MKRSNYLRSGSFLVGLIIIISVLNACKQDPDTQSNHPTKISALSETVFDEELARKLGADDYGMKRYVMAFLKRGPNRPQDSTARADLQRAHLDNITRLAEEGKLLLAGPFLDDGDVRGIYIFNTTTIEEAEELTSTDPAIQAGSLIMELKPWYGSATIMQINDLHKKIAKINI